MWPNETPSKILNKLRDFSLIIIKLTRLNRRSLSAFLKLELRAFSFSLNLTTKSKSQNEFLMQAFY